MQKYVRQKKHRNPLKDCGICMMAYEFMVRRTEACLSSI